MNPNRRKLRLRKSTVRELTPEAAARAVGGGKHIGDTDGCFTDDCPAPTVVDLTCVTAYCWTTPEYGRTCV